MPIGSCFSDANKERIARDFIITPMIHTHALPGSPKENCCKGEPIETWYYLLRYQSRANPKDRDHVFAGKICAEKLLRACGVEVLPTSDPLKAASLHQPVPGTGGAGGGGGSPGVQSVPFTQLNKECHTVISYLVEYMKEPPRVDGPIDRILPKLNGNPSRDLTPQDVKAINTTIARWPHVHLQTIIQDFVRRGYPVNDQQFPLMQQTLARLGEPDNIN